MFSVLLGGDVFIDRPSSKGVFDGVSSFRAESDFFFANLEVPLTNATRPSRWRASHQYFTAPRESIGYMKSRPEVVDDLSPLTAVTMANNHMMDFETEGLLETLDVLDHAGIGHAGAGRNWEEAVKPFVATKDGAGVALLSYTAVFYPGGGALVSKPGIAILKTRTAYEVPRRLYVMPGARAIVHTWVQDNIINGLEQDIAAAKEQADVVVVGFHWGVSDSHGIEQYQAQVAHACIDAGASIIHGVHPHHHGPLEIYKGCPIFYSFGHLVFDTLEEVRNTESMRYIHGRDSILARCLIDGDRVSAVEVIPLSPGENNSPVARDGSDGERIARQVMDFVGTRDRTATWTGSRLIVELDNSAPPHDTASMHAPAPLLRNRWW